MRDQRHSERHQHERRAAVEDVDQAAVDPAVRAGVAMRDVLRAVTAVADAGAAAVVMTYWNPVLRWGIDAFARDLASAGGLGLITPDLIPDEADEWIAASDEHGLDRIFLVAPSSTETKVMHWIRDRVESLSLADGSCNMAAPSRWCGLFG